MSDVGDNNLVRPTRNNSRRPNLGLALSRILQPHAVCVCMVCAGQDTRTRMLCIIFGVALMKEVCAPKRGRV